MSERPSIKRFEPRLVKPQPWGEEWLVALTDLYSLKVLKMNAGHGGPLQLHQVKDEAFHLLSGLAEVEYDPGEGGLVKVKMTAGESYHVPPGAVHRVTAIEDCVFVEASNPIFDDRVNVEDRY